MSLEGKQVNRYRIESLLGSGGMGDVYLANDELMQRQVAIKVMRVEGASQEDARKEATRLFLREAGAIAVLDHPNILPLYDFGQEQLGRMTVHYLVMPYRLEGTLAEWLQERSQMKALTTRDILHIVQQAAAALQHAHERQVIHQDIKPANFLLRAHGDRPGLMLTDFGIARLSTATASISQTVRGTPAYMAPEQWEGHSVAATDQYALAMMIYELLVGRHPFQGGPSQMMYQHLTTVPPAPSQLNPRIGQEIDGVLLRALSKKSEERYPSITTFARALEQAIEAASAQQDEVAAGVKELAEGQGDPTSAPLTSSDHEKKAEEESDEDDTLKTVAVAQRREEATMLANGSNGRLNGASVKSGSTISAFSSPPTPGSMNGTAGRVQSKRGRITIVAVVAIVLLLVMSGILIGVPAYQNHNREVSATAQANIARTAAVQSEATRVGKVQATASAIVQATANVRTSNPFPSYLPGRGTLALYDSLQRPQNWSVKPVNQWGGSCAFKDKSLHAIQNQPNWSITCPEKTVFSNFAFEVQMTILQGDCGGLLFRDDVTTGKQYFFRVCVSGYVSLLKADTNYNTAQIIAATNAAPTYRTGINQPNQLAVLAKGNNLSLYINGTLILTAQDSDFSKGAVGVAAGNLSLPTEVVYRNAKVWTSS